MADELDGLSPVAKDMANLAEGVNCLAIFVCDAARKITLDDEVRTGILRQGVAKLLSVGPPLNGRFPELGPTVAQLAAFAERRRDWKPESVAELERLASACLGPLIAQMLGNAGIKPGRCAIHGDICPDRLPATRLPPPIRA